MILNIINISILHGFISKVIVLIIMAGYHAYFILLFFTAHPDYMTIFIVVKTLNDFAFPIK